MGAGRETAEVAVAGSVVPFGQSRIGCSRVRGSVVEHWRGTLDRGGYHGGARWRRRVGLGNIRTRVCGREREERDDAPWFVITNNTMH